MAYNLFDFNGNRVTNIDLQNKGAWCKHGEEKEYVFISQFGTKFGLEINPSKTHNKYLPDLKYIGHNKLADLKTQNTPFFSSGKYGYDPQYVVTFNKKDRERYLKLYPDIDIYFWVDWQIASFQNNNTIIKVKPMKGISRIPFLQLNRLCERGPLHSYLQRTNDNKGNAKESYVIDLNSRGFEHSYNK